MASVTLLTYTDLIAHLQHFTRGGGQDVEQSDYRDALQMVYRDLISGREWRYFVTDCRILLNAPYSTGTLTFDPTAYTYPNEVLLSGGTWPSWAALGRIKIGNNIFAVQERKSDTILTLAANSNPGIYTAAASGGWTIYRNIYTLPSDFRSMYEPLAEQTQLRLRFIEPEQWHWLETIDANSCDAPNFWTIMGDPQFLGQMCIVVQSYVNSTQGLRFLYQREPRPLRYTGYDSADYAGTVSGSADSTAITGIGTAFTSAHIGSVIRFTQSTATDATKYPTGLNGLNPFTEQKIITDVASATSITVDTPLSADYLNKPYRISDPVDLFPAMVNALLKGAEKELANLRNRDDVEMRAAEYHTARMRAANADSMLQIPRHARMWRDFGLHSLTGPDAYD